MRLWIVFKSSVLAGFLWHHASCGEGASPHKHWEGMNVRILHSGPFVHPGERGDMTPYCRVDVGFQTCQAASSDTLAERGRRVLLPPDGELTTSGQEWKPRLPSLSPLILLWWGMGCGEGYLLMAGAEGFHLPIELEVGPWFFSMMFGWSKAVIVQRFSVLLNCLFPCPLASRLVLGLHFVCACWHFQVVFQHPVKHIYEARKPRNSCYVHLWVPRALGSLPPSSHLSDLPMLVLYKVSWISSCA